MDTPLSVVVVLVALAGCRPIEPETGVASGAAAPGAGPCVTDEPRLLHYARWLATDPEPRIEVLRRRYQIEAAEASEVEQVTDPATCLQAGRAYRNALDIEGVSPAVAVIRVGERYLVTGRVGGSTSSEFRSAVVFDEEFRVLSTFRR